jgi:hypothetical protein
MSDKQSMVGLVSWSIDSEDVSLFADYVQIFHAMENLTDGKINESINNVFRSAKSQEKGKKDKHESQSNQTSQQS